MTLLIRNFYITISFNEVVWSEIDDVLKEHTKIYGGNMINDTKKYIVIANGVKTTMFVFYIDIASLYHLSPKTDSYYEISRSIRRIETYLSLCVRNENAIKNIKREMEIAYHVAEAMVNILSGYNTRYCVYSDTHTCFVSFMIPLYLQLKKDVTIIFAGDAVDAKLNYYLDTEDERWDNTDIISDQRNMLMEYILNDINDDQFILLHGNHDVKFIYPEAKAYSLIVVINNDYQLIISHALIDCKYGKPLLQRTRTLHTHGDEIRCYRLDLSRINEPHFESDKKVMPTDIAIKNFLTLPCFTSVFTRYSSREHFNVLDRYELQLKKLIKDVKNKNPIVIVGHDFGYAALPYHLVYNLTDKDYDNKLPIKYEDEDKTFESFDKLMKENNDLELNSKSRLALRAAGYHMLSRVYGLDGCPYQKFNRMEHQRGGGSSYIMLIIVTIIFVMIIILIINIADKHMDYFNSS